MMDPIVAAHKAIDEAEKTYVPGKTWMHVTFQHLKPGDILRPHGATSPYGKDDPRHHVWVEHPENIDTWAGEMTDFDDDRMAKLHYYEVEPGEEPQPWGENGEEGWTTPHARIIREV